LGPFSYVYFLFLISTPKNLEKKQQPCLVPQHFLYIIIIIIILLIIRVIKAKFEIYEWQRVTDSDVEQTRHC
jgi:cell division protein FtsL